MKSRIVGLLFLFLGSCNSGERARMMKDLAGRYPLDVTQLDTNLLRLNDYKNTFLVLEESGNFHIASMNACINHLSGKWSLSNDWEISNYIFEYLGKSYETRSMSLLIRCNGLKGRLVFNAHRHRQE